MSDEKEIKDRILSKAHDMFLQFGYTKVTMEEIASDLGMSKKTLYKYFSGKEVLIKEISIGIKCEIDEYIKELWSDCNADFVQKLKKLMNFISKQNSRLRGPLLEDLQKNIPEVWAEIQELRGKHAHRDFGKLINEGVEKGAFRKDVNQEIIVLMYIHSIQGLLNPETLSQLPLTANQVFEAITTIMFQGILTDEGRLKYVSYQTEGEQ